MNPEQIVYVPMPVSEKPEKEGWYHSSKTGDAVFFDGKQWVLKGNDEEFFTHWLKPVPLSSIGGFSLKDMEECFEAGEKRRQSAIDYHSGYVVIHAPDKTDYLSSLKPSSSFTSEQKEIILKMIGDAMDISALQEYHSLENVIPNPYPDKETYLNSISEKL